tara:strand:- start:560 stop:1234 length:675 start_codon:yes stop_codon:yes gene_type:complete
MHQKLGNKKLITFYIFLIFLLSSINNYSLNISNFFKIKNIVVNGMSKDKNLKVESNLNFLLGENIFFLKDNIYNYFDKNNDVKNFNVKKLYPNSLEITITESKPICIILDNGKEIFLGDNGKILKSKQDYGNLLKVYGSSNIDQIFRLLKTLKKSSLNSKNIKSITFFKSNRFDLDLNDKVIKFPINYNDSILEYAYKILQDNNFVDAKIIDLRIDNKIIKNEQ